MGSYAWLQEVVAVLVGGAVNGTLMWSIGMSIGASGGSIALSQYPLFAIGGIFAYFGAAIVYSIVSPYHSLFSGPWIERIKSEGASPLSLGSIIVAGLLNGVVFGLLYSMAPATYYNWLVGIIAFGSYTLIQYLISLV